MRYYALILVCCLTALQSCERVTKPLSSYSVHGIDVSHYQSHIDWKAVAVQPISFAFIKATEGESHRDSLYAYNWAAARQANIVRGAYHFFRPNVAAQKQAENFIEAVGLMYGDLPPVLDIEVIDGVSEALLIQRIKEWLYLIEQHYQVKPIIYTNLKYHRTYLAQQLEGYPLWIARYNRLEPTLCNQQAWHFWQYGNRGRIDGIKGPVDLNIFNGSRGELAEMCMGLPPATISYQKPTE